MTRQSCEFLIGFKHAAPTTDEAPAGFEETDNYSGMSPYTGPGDWFWSPDCQRWISCPLGVRYSSFRKVIHGAGDPNGVNIDLAAARRAGVPLDLLQRALEPQAELVRPIDALTAQVRLLTKAVCLIAAKLPERERQALQLNPDLLHSMWDLESLE